MEPAQAASQKQNISNIIYAYPASRAPLIIQYNRWTLFGLPCCVLYSRIYFSMLIDIFLEVEKYLLCFSLSVVMKICQHQVKLNIWWVIFVLIPSVVIFRLFSLFICLLEFVLVEFKLLVWLNVGSNVTCLLLWQSIDGF